MPTIPAAQAKWGPMEYFGLAFHGFTVTHVDALCHSVWRGRMYNDRPASLVTARSGGLVHSVLAARDGIATRGVVLDIAGLLGKDWLDPGEGVFPEHLDAALDRQDVEVGEGDAVFIRTGYGRRRRERGHEDMLHVGQSGWHVASLPWVHEQRVAVIGSDTSQEVVPSGYDDPTLPVHAVGIVAMGLCLVDNLDLEDAFALGQELGRSEFHLADAPVADRGWNRKPREPRGDVLTVTQDAGDTRPRDRDERVPRDRGATRPTTRSALRSTRPRTTGRAGGHRGRSVRSTSGSRSSSCSASSNRISS